MIVVTGRYALVDVANFAGFALISFLVVANMYLWGTYSWVVPSFSWSFKRRILFANFSILISWAILSLFARDLSSEFLESRVLAFPIWGFGVISYFVRAAFFVKLKSVLKRNNFLVVGSLVVCQNFHRDVKEMGFEENFFYIINSENIKDMNAIPNCLGLLADLTKYIDRDRWAGVIVSLNSESLKSLSNILMEYKFSGLQLYTVSDYYEMNWLRLPLYILDKSWFAFSSGFVICHNNFWLRYKRIIDVFCSVLLFILTWPILLLFSLAIAIESKGGVIYKQQRIGMNGVEFTLYKLRTMYLGAESQAGGLWTAVGDKRITRVGKIARKLRVDEFPQLWNIFRGDMSLVGPRPEAVGLVRLYEKEIPFYNTRHLVKPGVTGWAQVMFGYGSSVEDSIDKLEYDLYYIKNYSFALDLNIFVKTLRVILGRKGI